MSKNQNKPTESELQILQVLWKEGPSTVRSVNDTINLIQESKGKATGYTTTLKIMQIMADKGLVIRDTSKRTHIYQASKSEVDTQGHLLNSFLQSTFKGSAMSLVMQTLGNHKASKEELREIKKLINQLENQ